jgi:hypothetical protein
MCKASPAPVITASVRCSDTGQLPTAVYIYLYLKHIPGNKKARLVISRAFCYIHKSLCLISRYNMPGVGDGPLERTPLLLYL